MSPVSGSEPKFHPKPLTAADLRRLADGSHPRPWTVLGAHLGEVDGVTGVAFSVWAPNARAVSVTGDFCDWQDEALPMTMSASAGVWERFTAGAAQDHRYRYVVHGADGRIRHKADPYGAAMDEPPGTASLVVEPTAFPWSDSRWLAERAARDPQRSPMRTYEVHLGSWRRGPHGQRLTYGELGPLLADHCLRHGFTHVELLPIAEHPFGGSWGYQVSGFYAPTSRFGTPDGLRSMIDLLHRSGIAVILDWVPAHFPRDEHALARFDGTPLYEHPDPLRGEHPDWGTLIFDFGRPEVRNFLVGSARYWLEEFHVDGLRVDAVASMLYLDYSRKARAWKPNILGGNHNLEAIDFLRELNERCHDGLPGVVTIAEESTAFAGVSRPIAEGGLGFDFKWDLGWMHDTLDYFARRPDRRWRHRREITFRGFYLDAEHWVLPLSHDEVVHLKRSLLGKMPGPLRSSSPACARCSPTSSASREEAPLHGNRARARGRVEPRPGAAVAGRGGRSATGRAGPLRGRPRRAVSGLPGPVGGRRGSFRLRLDRYRRSRRNDLRVAPPRRDGERREDLPAGREKQAAAPPPRYLPPPSRGGAPAGGTQHPPPPPAGGCRSLAPRGAGRRREAPVVGVKKPEPPPPKTHGLPLRGGGRPTSSSTQRQPIVAADIPLGGMPASAVIDLPALGTLFLRPDTD